MKAAIFPLLKKKITVFIYRRWRGNCVLWPPRVKFHDSGSQFIVRDVEQVGYGYRKKVFDDCVIRINYAFK